MKRLSAVSVSRRSAISRRAIATLPVDNVLREGETVELAEDLGLGEPGVDGTTYTYTPGIGATLPTVGAILVGPLGHSGYLRRVESVAEVSGQVVVETSDASLSDALSQIDDRDVYGAYEAATNRLFVASAANRATAVALERTFDRVAAARQRPAVRVTDVKPLPPKDPNGTALFYAVIAWVFGGYIASTLIGLIGSPRDSSRRRAASPDSARATFEARTSMSGRSSPTMQVRPFQLCRRTT